MKTSSIRYLIIFFSLPLFAQGHSFLFERIATSRGGSSEKIQCILQDSKGFIWFGTDDGLKKYDGQRFTTFQHEPDEPNSLSNGNILAMLEDHNGMIWIGTEGGGLNRLDPAKSQFKRYLPEAKNEKSLSHPIVSALFQSEDGILWIGTDGGGLNRLDPQTDSFRRFKRDPMDPKSISHNRIKVLHGDSKGNLWIGTGGGGLNLFDFETETFMQFKHNRFDNTSLSSNFVNTIYQNEDGVLWIGTFQGGLNRFNISSHQFQRFQNDSRDPYSLSNDNVNMILKDSLGRMWLATDKGLNRFDYDNARFACFSYDPFNSSSISDNQVLSLLCDRSGILWIGTAKAGINKLGKSYPRLIHYGKDPLNEKSLSNNSVSAFAEDYSGNLWVGTNGGGLNRLDRVRGEFFTFSQDISNRQSLSNDRILSLLVDHTGSVWIGTDGGGLNRYHSSSNQFERFQHQDSNPGSLSHDVVWALMEDHLGAIWVGTQTGVSRMNPETGKFDTIRIDVSGGSGLDQGAIWTLFEDHLHNVWLGSERGGLIRYQSDTQQFTHFQNNPADPQSISQNVVLSLFEDSLGHLWVGTWGGGLNLLDPLDNTFVHYGKKDGLPDEVIYGILGDDSGNLWLSTNHGLARFNRDTHEVTQFGLEDGLQGLAFNAGAFFKSCRGEMFFGGVNGLNIFRPENLINNEQAPPIVVTSMQLYDHVVASDISDTAEFEFNYDEDYFHFEFSALDFQNPNANQFAVLMEGQDSNWHLIGEGGNSNYRLSPGDFVFRVRGSNSEGVWNDKGVAIKIRVRAPYWSSWWFILLETLSVAILIVWGVVYQKRRFKRQKAKALIDLDLKRKTEELESARNLQLSMLPKTLPLVQGLDIAVYMQTATEVGGDYYDFLTTEDGSMTAAIGDATGHGLQAGIMVAATKALFNSFAAENEPVGILQKTSQALRAMGLSKMYMGLTLARFRERAVCIASAAMPYALLYRKNRDLIEEVELKGLPLGSFDYPYQQVDLQLGAGDVLLFASDGFEERFNDQDEMLGHIRVKDCFRESQRDSSREIINALVEAGEGWAKGRPQDDDVTFLVIKVQ